VDSNPRETLAKVPDARNAIDAVLAGTPVTVQTTPTVGCSIKWLEKEALHNAEMAKIEAEPIPLEKIGADGIKALRQNATGKTLLVNFWATWCAPCTAEFPELQKIYRMYRKRPFDLWTVSINYPDEEAGVRKFLESQHASSPQPAVRDDGSLRAVGRVRPWQERRGTLLGGDRARRPGALQGERLARRPQGAAGHPRQPARRRLQGAERLLEQPVSGVVLYCPGLLGA
jgi:thiol-disulfide isomerase/thioredoxin